MIFVTHACAYICFKNRSWGIYYEKLFYLPLRMFFGRCMCSIVLDFLIDYKVI